MDIDKINSIGSWVLIDSYKPNVANWLKALRISFNHIIDNDGHVIRLKRKHDQYILEGGYIYVQNGQLFRIGRSPNSYQIYNRKEDMMSMIEE